LNPEPQEYVIVSFGINMTYLRDFHGIKIEDPSGNENYRYKYIPIYCYDFSYSYVNLTTFLIRRSFLPMIKHKDCSEVSNLPDDTKKRWQNMVQINSDLSIYRKIIDLNKDKEVKNEYIR
jgi:hypothetical protein